jgi:hypothetical protein
MLTCGRLNEAARMQKATGNPTTTLTTMDKISEALMSKRTLVFIAVLILTMTIAVAGQGFKVYPGATIYTPPVTKDSPKAPAGTQITDYVTNDSFESVVAFYNQLGKEYTAKGLPSGGTLPNGQEIKQAYFIFDGAANLATSKSWVLVQRPLIGSIEMKLKPVYHDVRDVTLIGLSQKK